MTLKRHRICFWENDATCIVVLSSVRRVHWATAGKAWHTSMSDKGGLVLRTTVVKISMEVCKNKKICITYRKQLEVEQNEKFDLQHKGQMGFYQAVPA